jgi:hypothetical protein
MEQTEIKTSVFNTRVSVVKSLPASSLAIYATGRDPGCIDGVAIAGEVRMPDGVPAFCAISVCERQTSRCCTAEGLEQKGGRKCRVFKYLIRLNTNAFVVKAVQTRVRLIFQE